MTLVRRPSSSARAASPSRNAPISPVASRSVSSCMRARNRSIASPFSASQSFHFSRKRARSSSNGPSSVSRSPGPSLTVRRRGLTIASLPPNSALSGIPSWSAPRRAESWSPSAMLVASPRCAAAAARCASPGSSTAALAASASAIGPAFSSTTSWKPLCQIRATAGGRGLAGSGKRSLWPARWKSATRHATSSASSWSTPPMWSWSMWETQTRSSRPPAAATSPSAGATCRE